MAVRIGIERLVTKIPAQQTELPQMISDVLTHVGDGAIRPHDDLHIFCSLGLCRLFRALGFRRFPQAHDPAATVLSRVLVANSAGILHKLESGFPEIELENFAL